MKKGMLDMFDLNRIVKYLIYSDLIFYTGWGLISPIFAIFITGTIIGGSAFVVGMTAGINLIFRSILRVPFGIAADKSQKTSYYYMIIGLLLSAIVPLGFMFASTPMHIYILEAFLGATLAMSSAGWAGIFAKYMDKGKESTEWGIDAVAVGLGPGIAAIVGGTLVTLFSFNALFLIVTAVGLIGTFILLFIKKDVFRSIDKNKRSSPVHVPHEIRRLKKARI